MVSRTNLSYVWVKTMNSRLLRIQGTEISRKNVGKESTCRELQIDHIEVRWLLTTSALVIPLVGINGVAHYLSESVHDVSAEEWVHILRFERHRSRSVLCPVGEITYSFVSWHCRLVSVGWQATGWQWRDLWGSIWGRRQYSRSHWHSRESTSQEVHERVRSIATTVAEIVLVKRPDHAAS